MAIIEFKDQTEWHALRAKYIGASEVAALFGYSPWTTKWKLYMAKTGRLPAQDEKKWMTRGRHFEPAIASYAREEMDIEAIKVEHYWTDDSCPGLGASFDYTLLNDHGVPVEIKWVERYDGWEWNGGELTKIPDYYLLQVQHQMACSGAPRAIIIAFIGGMVRYMIVPRSDGIISAIRTQVTQFWADVSSGKEPPVDWLEDADTIFDIAGHRPLRSTELPQAAEHLFQTYLLKKEERKTADDAMTAAEAELTKMVMDTPGSVGNDGKAIAFYGPYKMSLTKIADNPGKLVTPDMVGSTIGARKGHLRTTISQTKEK
jgi:putative phage-type endonuclease